MCSYANSSSLRIVRYADASIHIDFLYKCFIFGLCKCIIRGQYKGRLLLGAHACTGDAFCSHQSSSVFW